MNKDTTTFTESDFKAFKRLVEQSESRLQMDRIESRLAFPKFIEEHGKEKCDAMFAKLNRRENPTRRVT